MVEYDDPHHNMVTAQVTTCRVHVVAATLQAAQVVNDKIIAKIGILVMVIVFVKHILENTDTMCNMKSFLFVVYPNNFFCYGIVPRKQHVLKAFWFLNCVIYSYCRFILIAICSNYSNITLTTILQCNRLS